MTKDRFIGDLIFYFQIIMATLIGISQFVHMIFYGMRGLSLTSFFAFQVADLINLSLAIRANKIAPSRLTRQRVAVYSIWSISMGVILVYMAYGLLFSGEPRLDLNDALTVLGIIISLVIILIVARVKKYPSNDPIIRGIVGGVMKSMPHISQLVKIFVYGARGLSPIMVLGGNLTVTTRIIQTWLAIREAGWDRNRTGSMIAEVSTEFSWVAVTLVYFLWYFGNI